MYNSNETDSLNIVKKEKSVILNILNHLVYVLFAYIIEFLAFIYYIEILPDKFIIKRDEDYKILNIIIAVLNTILIIGINAMGVIHLVSINQQGNEKDVPIKYRFSNRKFYVLYLMQNFILLEAIPLYLPKSTLKTFRIIIFIFIGLLFVGIFFSSLRKFNYPTIINKFLGLCSYFSFFSIFKAIND